MKRINTPTAVNNRFVSGDKTIGRKATQFSAEWCNQIQEELWNLIKLLSGADPTGVSEHELADAFNPLVLRGAGGVSTLKNTSVNFAGNSGESSLTQDCLEFTKDGTTYKATLSRDGLAVEYEDSLHRKYVMSVDHSKIRKTFTMDGTTVAVELEFDTENSTIGAEQFAVESLFEKNSGSGINVFSKINFNSVANFLNNVVVGTNDRKKNITVNGKCSADVFNSKLITIDDDYAIVGDYPEGDILYVYNSTSTTKKVYCTAGQYVELNGGCAMGFIRAGNLYGYFAPLANATFYAAS